MNNQNRIHWTARLTLAVIFIWHGLVPKILLVDAGEQQLIAASPFPLPLDTHTTILIVGIVELMIGVLLLYRHWQWPVYLSAATLIILLAYCALFTPALLGAAFNPLSTNLAALALCYIIYLTQTRM